MHRGCAIWPRRSEAFEFVLRTIFLAAHGHTFFNMILHGNVNVYRRVCTNVKDTYRTYMNRFI